MKISAIAAYEILDSRGVPTILCSLTLSQGIVVQASVPSGKSKGSAEALELRDQDGSRYQGQGVLAAVAMINLHLAPLLCGIAPDIFIADQIMREYDGTADKSRCGANTLLVVSYAVLKAQAIAKGCQPYELIAQLCGTEPHIPLCMFNLINGGAHAQKGPAFQEFMVVSARQRSFADQLQSVAAINYCLKAQLERDGLCAGVGDEGGSVVLLNDGGLARERRTLDILMVAVEQAGSAAEVSFALDVAASQLYDSAQQKYVINGDSVTPGQLVDIYESLLKGYPIVSIEDGLHETDWAGWQMMTQRLKNRCMLVGDDIFVTNPALIQKGFEMGAGNAVIIKPNQIGTVTEALEAVATARTCGYKIVVSHRSGETNDDIIADFAFGVAADYFKAGACVRGERVAKYNRLLRIEQEMLR